MLRLRRRPSRDSLYRELLDEKDKRIERLEAEIAAFRMHGPAPVRMRIPAAVADGEPAELGSPTWDSELDEATAILAKEGLSQVHLPEILDALGVGSSDLS